VSTGAGQIADVAQSLAEGATEQASSIEDLSGMLINISAETKSKVENGIQKMGQMVKSVEAINQASNEISSIINIIDNIAFQTNILALNASVEAAHAGSRGKGFAVVAEEVKRLANRSQEAAQDTNQLIEKSVRLVENGMSIARDTQAALESIVVTIEKLNEVMAGVNKISEVVRNNSATAQESAAASEVMSSQSSLLQKLIEQFKLSGNVGGAGGVGGA
jgi:methyl-accepting chemotaxis protein